MFDVPVDGWYAWIGLAVASVVVLGTAASLPIVPPPDAAGVADTVDRAASAEYGATATHPLDADAVRLGPRRIGLRNDAGTTHAAFGFGPVTPVRVGMQLDRVLDGAPPGAAFESGEAFRQAVIAARSRDPRWRPVDGPLVVRRVSWEGVDATLVGA